MTAKAWDTPAMITAAVLLAACQTTDRPVVGDGGGPSSGVITTVDTVKLTPEQGDVIQVRGSSSKDFSYDDLQAVLYCRAWQHSRTQGFAGAHPLRFHKLEGTNAAAARVAIASVQLYQGATPAGKTPLGQSWCNKVPSAAR
ncbi:MAG: hypothetical protein AAF441_16620 [Pseudomonadota bacterium]